MMVTFLQQVGQRADEMYFSEFTDSFSLADQGPSLADTFEYVMYGKVYRIEGNKSHGDSGRL